MTQASIIDMVGQTREVISKRNVGTFESFENKGGLQEALIYTAIAAAIAGLFGLGDGIRGFVNGVLTTLVGFLAFTYIVFWMGKQQGGTGTLDQVAYTFSLFWVPLSLLLQVVVIVLGFTLIGIPLIPVALILFLIGSVYFAYLATKSSMNLSDNTKIWITLFVATIGLWIVKAVVDRVLM
jgi:ABC-type antimicrobial peptide transport system permease subunit